MGRLQTLSSTFGGAAVDCLASARMFPIVCAITSAMTCAMACDNRSGETTSARSEQVMSTASAPAAAPGPPDAHGTAATAAPRLHGLCDGDGNAEGRTLSRLATAHAEAPGAPPLAGSLRVGHGRWTWINFWAAWCKPCKEEIPRLFAWRDRLASSHSPLSLVFVSLDDDARQLDSFLEQQPPDGLRSTLWLPDGPARTGWMTSLRMKSAPELPEHALVDTAGRVRCFIEGAVDESDYAEIAALVR
jgi:thiol-disulfide isomerase/thioredoxin